VTGSNGKRFRFVQLYTSRSYESRRQDLLNPEEDEYESKHHPEKYAQANATGGTILTPEEQFNHHSNQNNSNGIGSDVKNGSQELVQKHVLSPRLVETISQTAQVVWATTKKQEGLIGRSDVRLQTAVGMPVAVDANGNLCVVVMFSPNAIQSTDDAMEYLYSISQSATTTSIPCLLPVFNAETVNQMKQLPMSTTASSTQTNGTTTLALKPPTPPQRKTVLQNPDNALGEGVSARFVTVHHTNTDSEQESSEGENDVEVHVDHELSEAPKDTFGIPMLPSFAELGGSTTNNNSNNEMGNSNVGLPVGEGDDAFDEATYGIWNTIMGIATDDQNTGEMDDGFDSTMHGIMSAVDSNQPQQQSQQGFGDHSGITSPPHIVSDQSLTLATDHPAQPQETLPVARQERLIEFCLAFLGMSVFDLADVWVPTAEKDSLRHVFTVSSSTEIAENPNLQNFQAVSEATRIALWNGAVGRAFSTGNPVWSSNEQVFADAGRAGAFAQAQFKTVLAVPVFGKRSGMLKPTCVVTCYAFVKSGSVPFVLRFVQQALRLLWDGLDRIEFNDARPANVSAGVWQNVAPADLGEMAADVEMQQHFQARTNKRKFFRGGSNDESDRDLSQTETSLDDVNHILNMQQVALDQPEQEQQMNVQMVQQPTAPQEFVQVQVQQQPMMVPQHIEQQHPQILQLQEQHPNGTWMPVASTIAPPLQVTMPTSMNNETEMSSIELPNGDVIDIPLSLPVDDRSFAAGVDDATDFAISTDDGQAAALAASLPPPSPSRMDRQRQDSFFQQGPMQMPSSQASSSSQKWQQQQYQHGGISTNSKGTKRAHVIRPAAKAQRSSSSSSFNAPTPLVMPQTLPLQLAPSSPSSSTSYARTSTGAIVQIQPLQTAKPSPSSSRKIVQQQRSVPSTSQHRVDPQPLKASPPTPPMVQQPFVSTMQQQMPQLQQQRSQITPMAIPSSSGTETSDASMQQPDFAGSMPVFCLPIANTGTNPALDGGSNMMGMAQNPSYNANTQAVTAGVLKVCRIQGCNESAVTKRPYCIRHSGNRQCEHPSCTKCAQGSTRFCIAHGGGRRCTFPGCDKGARDKFFCAAHGGGKRCQFPGGCTKSAVGGSNLCTAHGGGRRCSVQGCNKSAQSSTKFCVKHGGGKKCLHDGCQKVARGRTQYCAAHGGGVRCKLEGCNRVAIGKLQLCRAHGGGSSRGGGTNTAALAGQAQQVQMMGGMANKDQSAQPILLQQTATPMTFGAGMGDPMAAAAAAAAAASFQNSQSPEMMTTDMFTSM